MFSFYNSKHAHYLYTYFINGHDDLYHQDLWSPWLQQITDAYIIIYCTSMYFMNCCWIQIIYLFIGTQQPGKSELIQIQWSDPQENRGHRWTQGQEGFHRCLQEGQQTGIEL